MSGIIRLDIMYGPVWKKYELSPLYKYEPMYIYIYARMHVMYIYIYI